MTSLLQFRGKLHKEKGVGLVGYLSEQKTDHKGKTYHNGQGIELEDAACPRCGKVHPVLYRFYRKPAGRWGHWVVFRINGKKEVPDLSCPLWLGKIPKGAKRLSLEEAASEWHDS